MSQEEALHLEVKALLAFKPDTKDLEGQYIYNKALEIFFEQHGQQILRILDQHLKTKMR